MKLKAPVIVGFVVLIAALIVVLWLWQKSRVPEAPSEEAVVEEPAGLGAEISGKTQGAQEAIQAPVPETNPFKKANPFTDAYKNPFQ